VTVLSCVNFCFDSTVKFYLSSVKFILFIMFHCFVLYIVLFCLVVIIAFVSYHVEFRRVQIESYVANSYSVQICLHWHQKTISGISCAIVCVILHSTVFIQYQRSTPPCQISPHRCIVPPLWGEKPQNRLLSNLNTGSFRCVQCYIPVSTKQQRMK